MKQLREETNHSNYEASHNALSRLLRNQVFGTLMGWRNDLNLGAGRCNGASHCGTAFMRNARGVVLTAFTARTFPTLLSNYIMLSIWREMSLRIPEMK